MRFRVVVTAMLCVLFLASTAGAQQVEFNYNGRVNVQGVPFDGDGLFKFTLVSADGSVTYWANDGVTLDGSQPTSPIAAHVVQGFFSVNIGDTSTTDMAPLDASLFNDRDRVCLRVWFSDQVNGFERLLPDREVVNPALIGLQSFSKSDIYVDPAIGNDKYTGLNPSRPKKTIQSAWDALPPMIRQDATIHLANGVYYESVLLQGKSVIGEATITLCGNTTSPQSVRVTGGADGATSTTPFRANGFYVKSQQRLTIKGVQIEHFTNIAVYLLKNCDVTVSDCKIFDALVGILPRAGSTAVIQNVEVGNLTGLAYGLWADGGYMWIYECNLHHLQRGVISERHGTANVRNTIVSNATQYGFNSQFMGLMTFQLLGNQAQNCNVGLEVSLNSITLWAVSGLTCSGCPTARHYDASSVGNE